MARRFAEIAFTPSVLAAQARWTGSGLSPLLDPAVEPRAIMGPREAEFIAARDGAFLATVGEGGWPYVQFRGGTAGFLKVLDERTLAFADFRGNRQYLSVGNLAANGRAMLFLIDHAARRRLKIWARARLVEPAADLALAERLALPGYAATVERLVVLDVEAFDWNCPQHITPRFTEAEVEAAIVPLRQRLDALAEENAGLKARLGVG